MSERIYINNDWKFTKSYSDELANPGFNESGMEDVRLPHTVAETPFNYFDESIYQMVSGYRRHFAVPKEWQDKCVRLTFEGVAHESRVFVNGKQVISHNCGYTAFSADITEYINYGSDNVIAVRVDSNESLDQPPFGFVIDYMTYGGIYRDVYFEISDRTYIEDVFLSSVINGGSAVLRTELGIKNEGGKKIKIRQFLDGAEVLTVPKEENVLETKVEKIILWDVEDPKLYEVRTELCDEASGDVLDSKTVRFGFRTSEFRKDGYFLNGRKLKIRGLNRHQSYPYVGYAMPASMQRLDADILKNELGLNAVRTSHYPQSHHFIDRCDEIGLLVFTEIPGWQHIGGAEWKDIAVENTKDMVKQYRNHPSVILWGVRINESKDDDEFYERTNLEAHKLDPTRPTGGVRAHKKSSLLEDVYTYNDFVHDGKARGCEPKKAVTSDVDKPYLISEYNGHMYSTKAYDCEDHRKEHAIRHANVLSAVMGEEDIAGSFGWCMSDYNTHKDFGSGDRICYHGVLDMFRNPKQAAYVYSSFGKKTVLELSSTMDIGEHPACNRGDTFIYSNADSVRMYKNDRFIKEYTKKDSPYEKLPFGPILIDDFIGDAIYKGEAQRPQWVRKALTESMNATACFGLGNLPKKILLNGAKLLTIGHMRADELVSMYNKYVGDWGGKSTVYKFEAIKDGKVVLTKTYAPTKGVHILAEADHTDLAEKETYDVCEVRIRIVDDFGNPVFFFHEPLSFEAEGPVKIIGEKTIGAKGGMAGVYLKTTGSAGKAVLTVKNAQCDDVKLEFTVTV